MRKPFPLSRRTSLCASLLLLLCWTTGAQAQQYYYTVQDYIDAGNPGNVVTEDDDLTGSWTSITTGGESTNAWSAPRAIPFTFKYYGATVDSFKVSFNGLLTFDTRTTTLPNNNASLPTSTLPDSTVAVFWDAFTASPPIGTTDRVYTRTFGTAPNRQFWIKWYSYEYSGFSFAYFAVMLEESTNKIYIVDYNYNSGSGTSTIGVQLNSSQATQFASNYDLGTGDWDPADNDIYEFTPQVVVDYNVVPVAITTPLSGCGLGQENITVQLQNRGSLTLVAGDTIRFSYRINSGNVVQEDFILTSDVDPSDTITYSFNARGNLASGGSYTFTVTGTGMNEEITSDDTLVATLLNTTINNFPYEETFTTFPANNGTGPEPNPLPNGWVNVQQEDGDEDWYGRSGTVPSVGTGPSGDHTTGSGNYLYVEDSGYDNDTVSVIRPCIDTRSLTFPVLAFWVHSLDANGPGAATENFLHIDVFYESSWIEDVIPPIGHVGADWTRFTADLSPYNGLIDIRFRVNNNNGDFTHDIAIDDVMIFDSCDNVTNATPPTASFNLPDSVFVGTPFSVQATTNPNEIGKLLFYLDGQPVSSMRQFTSTLNTVGTSTVSLVFTNCGGSDSVARTIRVVAPTQAPTAQFVANTNTVAEGETVSLFSVLTNGPSSWDWEIRPAVRFNPATNAVEPAYEFVDGTDTSSFQPVVRFLLSGTYEICLTASNAVGSTTVCKPSYIEVTEVELICISSGTSAQEGILYDDGGPTGEYSNNANCNYLIDPCASEVRLTITEMDIEEDFEYLRIYDGTNNQGTPLWNETLYPDGITGTFTNPVAEFGTLVATTGTVYIEFESDGSVALPGFAIEWESTPAVIASPVAGITGPDTICPGEIFTLVSTSTGDRLEQRWYLTDPDAPDGVGPDFSYLIFNTSTVMLVVENCGGMDTAFKTIVVRNVTAPPVADFSIDIANPSIQDVVTFMPEIQGCASDYTWRFSPSTVTFVNSSATSPMPRVRFNNTGCYDVTLIVENSFGVDSITHTCVVRVSDLCVPSVAALINDIGITRVEVDSIDNASASADQGYTDFTTSGTEARLGWGENYEITVSRASAQNNVRYKVWIDYNQDGDFADAGEMAASSGSVSSRSWTASFTVPATAMMGAARMRVGVTLADDSLTACGPATFGEYEDYRVRIIGDVTPPIPNLFGGDTVFMQVFTPYIELGANAQDAIAGTVFYYMQESNVDTATVGTYQVRYFFRDPSGNDTITVRTVIVGDTIAPVLTLIGGDTLTIALDSAFVDPGYAVTDNYDPNPVVTVTGSVNTGVVGDYIIRYTATDSLGNTTVRLRLVLVRDTLAPTATLVGDASVTIPVNTTYNDPGVQVNDPRPTTVVNGGNFYQFFPNGFADSIGTFTIQYSVYDADSNLFTLTRTVTVVDNEAPVITLVGPMAINIERWQPFTDPGYTLGDNYYDSLEITVVPENTVDIQLPGTYTVRYQAIDPSGNVSYSETRIVTVRQTTGVAGNENELEIGLYPNPTRGNLVLRLNDGNVPMADLKVIDMSGRVVWQQNRVALSNGQVQLNMSTLPAGIYRMQAMHPDGQAAATFVISR